MRYHNLAMEHINLNMNKKVVKDIFCKDKEISRNSLNTGLKLLDVEIAHKVGQMRTSRTK